MKKNYKNSDLTKRITIYKKDSEGDGAGGQNTIVWKDKKGLVVLKKRFAKVEVLTGKYLYDARMAQEETTHNVIVRYDKKLANQPAKSLIIDYNGRRLDVDYVLDIEEERLFLNMRSVENSGKNRR